MDTKQLLLEKFVYIFNNSEIISDCIEFSNKKNYSKQFSYSQLESLLFSYKYLHKDDNYQLIETYKKTSDFVCSYDVAHKSYLTGDLFNKVIEHIRNQTIDIPNKDKKLEIMKKYFELLLYINYEEVIKNSYIKNFNRSRLTICSVSKLPTLCILNYNLIKTNKYDYHSISNTREKITWVKNNNFIRFNVDVLITEEDKRKVLEAIRKEKRYIKKRGMTKR